MSSPVGSRIISHLPGLWLGGALALASAVLFGASTPVAKTLLGTTDPWMLAGLLYLGSGVGLFVVRLVRRRVMPSQAETTPERKDWLWLAGAVLAGGVLGPLLLMSGLALTSASAASLLLTLEGVFTALIAWVVFREHFQWRIGIGMVAISAGAVTLAWTSTASLDNFAGPLLIAAACLAWAIDNNFTRKVALSDPVQIAMIKGLVAGSSNFLLSLATGGSVPDLAPVVLAGIAGFAGYGVSLVLFVIALRHIGTARTGAYFSTAPFVGTAIAVVVLNEPMTPQILGAGILMGIGVWLHLTETHFHEHGHQGIVHVHRHRHDDHHQHEHVVGEPAGEPHTHPHAHSSALKHVHPHYPDAHHVHSH